ncbi:ferredoxin [Rhodococcus sp. OK302]|uniref:ferredoxin n=1 Tax=Rhodococcus sp. OK302 TaxID=1882769 RepID=UPI000B9F45E9|nr:ferredoxin [Rhodococcus sp. OK302]OYD61472.1 ferredoxin [Rhodococcus sp. OK302]
MSVRIEIARDRCTGHGRCYMLVPELFDSDDEGAPVVLVDDAEFARADALTAAANCPESAILVRDLATGLL